MRDALVRDRCLFETATGQAGYFTAVQARACDYSWALLSHHAARGRFVRVRRGLYRLRDYPSSPREEVMAAWLAAGPGAVVSHESALDLLGLTDVIPDRINLTVARSTRGRRPPRALAIHTAEHPPDADEVVIRDGMRVTGAARTIADMARTGLPPDQLSTAIRQAIARGLTTRDQLLSAAHKQGTRVSQLIRSLLDRTGE